LYGLYQGSFAGANGRFRRSRDDRFYQPPHGRLGVERFSADRGRHWSMSSGQNTGGLMSSAGLVRYFDAEDRNAIRIDPKTVIAFGIFFGLFVQIMTIIG
jgi:preprotein translocase subunit Sec61beta